MSEELAWTLERVCAKVMAGMVVAARLRTHALFDTQEYAPFISDIVVQDPALMKCFASDASYPPLDVTVAALAKKPVPEARVSDTYRLFASLRDQEELVRLRAALSRIEECFGELIATESELVRGKLAQEIGRAEMEYEETVAAAMASWGQQTKWHTIDMLAGQFAGFLGPWVEDAKAAAEAERRQITSHDLLSRGDLSSDVFFLAQVWERYRVLQEAKYQQMLQDRLDVEIWGQDKSDVPWYEQPE